MRVNRMFVRDSPNVTEYAYIQEKNQSYRHQMEDNYVAEDNIVQNKAGFFAILDGHGGADVSEYCSKNLPEIFKEEYQKEPNSIKTLFTTICKRVDGEVESINAADRGTTCCLVLVERRGPRRYCCIGNLGDTRAVICTDKQIAKRVSIDHKVNNPSEVDRIKSEGGTILKGRVAGTLAITRALGDLDIKPYVQSNIPDYQQFEIDQRVRYMIVASDGLWDVCEDQQAIQLCKGCPTSKDMSKKLVSHAVSNGSKDNISILVLKF